MLAEALWSGCGLSLANRQRNRPGTSMTDDFYSEVLSSIASIAPRDKPWRESRWEHETKHGYARRSEHIDYTVPHILCSLDFVEVVSSTTSVELMKLHSAPYNRKAGGEAIAEARKPETRHWTPLLVGSHNLFFCSSSARKPYDRGLHSMLLSPTFFWVLRGGTVS